jgi:hypothetical protein
MIGIPWEKEIKREDSSNKKPKREENTYPTDTIETRNETIDVIWTKKKQIKPNDTPFKTIGKT